MSDGTATHNVVRYLDHQSFENEDRPALVEPGKEGPTSWTFGELKARADWMAAGLREQGIRAGDRVIIMVPMSLKLYQVLLGVLEIGAVAVFADPWVGPRSLAGFASYAEPKGFVGVAKSHAVRLFDKSLRQLPVTVTTGGRVWCIPARSSWSEVIRYEGPIRPYRNQPGDTALITFTSGSSGIPKGADRTHHFLSAQHEALNAEFPYRDDDVDMPTFPVFSLNNLANGVTTVIPDIDFRRVADADGRQIVEQMRTHGVTTATASPPFFDRLCDALEADDTDVGLRRILTGGAPVTKQQLRRWQRALPETEIVVIYGSTEAEPVAHISADQRLEASATCGDGQQQHGYCVGAPVDALDAKIIPIRRQPVVLDDGGWEELELADGQVGELVISGAHVCEQYFRNPQATAENKIVEDDGTVWHRMGDTGYIDDRGRFWLTGRVHSTIVRSGTPLQAQVVEQIAAGDDPNIERIAAVGLPDERLGEHLVAVIELVSGADEGQAVDGVRRRLRDANLPLDAVVVRDDPLPVDPRHNAKIDYAALRRELSPSFADDDHAHLIGQNGNVVS